MPLQIAPYVVETAGEVIKFVVREAITRRLNTVDAPSVRVLPTIEPLPSVGCPYCAIGRSLAATYLYLNRLAVRPQLAAIYAELSRDQLDDAMMAVRGLPESLPHAELENTIRGYVDALAVGPDATEAAGLAKKVWNTANIAMRLAEQKQEKSVKGAEGGH